MQDVPEILFRYKHFFKRHPGGKREKQGEVGTRGYGETPPGYQVALVSGEVWAKAKSAFLKAQRES